MNEVRTTASHPVRFDLYRWDYELATSASALVIVSLAFVESMAFFGVVVWGIVSGFRTDAFMDFVRLMWWIGALYAFAYWLGYLINGLPRWNYIELDSDSISLRRHSQLRVNRDEVADISPYRPDYRLPSVLFLLVATPNPFSTRWAVPPSGGYVLTLKGRRFLGSMFPPFVKRLYFAPRTDEGLGEALRAWQQFESG